MIGLDLSGIVDAFAVDTLTRKRWAAAAWSKGVATYAAPAEATISGMVEPLPGEVLEQLPEGQRRRARFMLHTTADVVTVDRAGDQRADHLTYLGSDYEAAELSAWQGQGKFRALVLLELGAE